MNTVHSVSTETSKTEITRIFNLQRDNRIKIASTAVSERKNKLKRLYDTVMKFRPQLKEALYNDFRKHPSEVDLTEIFPVTSEIKHTKANLHRWMKKQKISTPIAFVGASSYIQYEPKGTTLIISPWNFPVNLTLGPLVSAIAAGNTAILKPSENTPHTSRVMKSLIESVFDESEVALVEGGVDTSRSLLSLPFNHIYFTGAPEIGKLIMKAAAENLASVTLELGGKSPTIVDETADIETAARRIAWGKFVNNGQVCLAPDHIYVHTSKKAPFLEAIRKYITQFYSGDASTETSYARIINSRHYQRLKGYLDDAALKGASFQTNGELKESENFIPPTLVTGASADSKIMQEEIFGPLLPVIEFTELDTVIRDINNREKPLALYIYSRDKNNIKKIISLTSAGGTCINHNAIHFFNHNLPFGGVNNSGIGKGHGKYGFEEFSNARAVMVQHFPNALEKLLPPYNKAKQKLIDMTIRYF